MWDDVRAIQYQMAPYINQGREFIIIGHGYGGYPAFASTQNWTVSVRQAAGLDGGVRGLVFFAATVPTVPGMMSIHMLRPGEILYPPIFHHGPVGKKVRAPVNDDP